MIGLNDIINFFYKENFTNEEKERLNKSVTNIFARISANVVQENIATILTVFVLQNKLNVSNVKTNRIVISNVDQTNEADINVHFKKMQTNKRNLKKAFQGTVQDLIDKTFLEAKEKKNSHTHQLIVKLKTDNRLKTVDAVQLARDTISELIFTSTGINGYSHNVEKSGKSSYSDSTSKSSSQDRRNILDKASQKTREEVNDFLRNDYNEINENKVNKKINEFLNVTEEFNIKDHIDIKNSIENSVFQKNVSKCTAKAFLENEVTVEDIVAKNAYITVEQKNKLKAVVSCIVKQHNESDINLQITQNISSVINGIEMVNKEKSELLKNSMYEIFDLIDQYYQTEDKPKPKLIEEEIDEEPVNKPIEKPVVKPKIDTNKLKNTKKEDPFKKLEELIEKYKQQLIILLIIVVVGSIVIFGIVKLFTSGYVPAPSYYGH